MVQLSHPYMTTSFDEMELCQKSIIKNIIIIIKDILKTRDITLPTKVRLAKAMVFPVVMYGCESWTREKAEH